jgi:hypothetical protein
VKCVLRGDSRLQARNALVDARSELAPAGGSAWRHRGAVLNLTTSISFHGRARGLERGGPVAASLFPSSQCRARAWHQTLSLASATPVYRGAEMIASHLWKRT